MHLLIPLFRLLRLQGLPLPPAELAEGFLFPAAGFRGWSVGRLHRGSRGLGAGFRGVVWVRGGGAVGVVFR